jgi:hypothetical protein
MMFTIRHCGSVLIQPLVVAISRVRIPADILYQILDASYVTGQILTADGDGGATAG